jgi:hypothetical protein
MVEGLWLGGRACQVNEQRGDQGKRCDVIDGHVIDRALGHRRKERIGGILDDGDAAQPLDHVEAARPIVEVAGKDDADGAGAEDLGRGSEERVDGWPEAVLARSLGDPQPTGFDNEVAIGWCYVDVTALQEFAVARMGHRERAGTVQDLGEHTWRLRRRVDHDAEHSWKIGRQHSDHCADGLEAS